MFFTSYFSLTDVAKAGRHGVSVFAGDSYMAETVAPVVVGSIQPNDSGDNKKEVIIARPVNDLVVDYTRLLDLQAQRVKKIIQYVDEKPVIFYCLVISSVYILLSNNLFN